MSEIELDNKRNEQEIELDDLLISNGDEDSKGSQSKKIILLGAIAVILFAVVILVVYFFQSGGDKTAKEDTFDTQKPVERVEVQPTPTPANNNGEFQQVPIQNEPSSDKQFEEIIATIKAQQAQQQNQQTQTQNLPTPPAEQQPKQQPKPQEAPKPATKPSPSETFQGVQTSTPKAQGGNAQKGFYIQVGSFSKYAPNQKILDTIRDAQYGYHTQKVNENTTRLLVGPFKSRQEAQAELSNVKEKINKDAFIKEVK